MPASSSREKRKKMRNGQFKHTGVMKKAKRNSQGKPKFDTSKENDNVVRDIGNRKRLHEHDLCDLQPANARQEEFLRLFYEGTELLVASGSAGVGKSFLAMHCALREVLRDDTPYDKVILVRSAVQSREIGFLPGESTGANSKAAPFEEIYHGLVQNIMPKFKDGYTHLKSLNYLEFHLTSFLRGATFDRSIIILDEAASNNYHELSTVLTRCGLHSRVIILGDTRQDDLKSKGRKSDQSGFTQFLNVIQTMPASMVGVVEFSPEDSVRSGLVREFLLADYKSA